MLRTLPLIAALALVAACSSDDDGATGSAGTSGTGAAGGSGGAAGSSGSSGAAGAASCDVADVETIADHATHTVERFSYRSGALKIFGEGCRPKKSPPYPVLFWNHGGFQGLGAGDRTICENVAKDLGWLTVMSEYRGEGGSEGEIEVCLGEADDVVALVQCALEQPGVDPSRTVMAGGSHGGCITLRAIQKGAPVAAAVDVFGPTDLATEHAFLKAELAAAPQGPLASTYQQLIQIVELAAGGSPAEAPAAYAVRSPALFGAELAAWPGSLLVVHGVEDVLVPPEQSCLLLAASSGFEARHYASDAATVLTTPPPGCVGSGVPWLGTPKPSPSWPGARHAVIYDGANHALSTDVPGQAAMVQDLLTFLVAKMPP